MSWIPPHGTFFFRIQRPIKSSLSKSFMLSMLTSSRINCWVSFQLRNEFGLDSTMSSNCGPGAEPSPMPAHRWSVTPPILTAATPVVAVTAVPFTGKAATKRDKRKLFPVPAGPLMRQLCPCCTWSSAACCSALSDGGGDSSSSSVRCLFGAGWAASDGSFLPLPLDRDTARLDG